MPGGPRNQGSVSSSYGALAPPRPRRLSRWLAAGRAAQPGAFVISLALISIAACKPVGPNYNRPGYNAPSVYKETGAPTVVVPPPNPQGGAWQPANPSDGMLKGKWWEIYQDPQLNQLEDRAETNNVQLRQALETYLAAHDQVSAARANLLSRTFGRSFDQPRQGLRQSPARDVGRDNHL